MATNQPITIDAGATYSVEFEFETAGGAPVDISTYTARFQIRKSPIADVAVINTVPTINVNKVLVELTATQTGTLTEGPYVYGIELYKAAEVIRFVEGVVTVTPEIVRL
jgi:hypothetical protein